MCAAAAAAAARAGKSPSWARRARVTRQQQQRHSYLRTPLPPPIHMLSGQTDRQTDGQHVRTYHSVRSVHSIRLIAVCMCVCAHMRTSRPPNRSRAPVSRPALRSTEGASFFLWCLVEGGIGLDWTGLDLEGKAHTVVSPGKAARGSRHGAAATAAAGVVSSLRT